MEQNKAYKRSVSYSCFFSVMHIGSLFSIVCCYLVAKLNLSRVNKWIWKASDLISRFHTGFGCKKNTIKPNSYDWIYKLYVGNWNSAFCKLPSHCPLIGHGSNATEHWERQKRGVKCPLAFLLWCVYTHTHTQSQFLFLSMPEIRGSPGAFQPLPLLSGVSLFLSLSLSACLSLSLTHSLLVSLCFCACITLSCSLLFSQPFIILTPCVPEPEAY